MKIKYIKFSVGIVALFFPLKETACLKFEKHESKLKISLFHVVSWWSRH